MSESPPVIYLLYGDDEYAISQFVKEMEGKLGDESIASLNISHLDGKILNIDELLSIASAMPFLARRRLVILQNPTINLPTEEAKKKFLDILERIPDSTGIVLIEDTSDRFKKNNIQWLLSWTQQGTRSIAREFSLPRGAQMQGWILKEARSLGGSFTPQAAVALANLVGNDTRLANQEIEKLLAYVNYQRIVDVDDVEMSTTDYAEADIFSLVDAISNLQSRQAMSVLRKMLDQQEPMMIFAMVQRQFRLLIQAREVLDHGGGQGEIAKQLKSHPFVAEKLNKQARQFDLKQLEMVYRRLLDLDEGIKTGQIEVDLALETFVAAFTSQ